MINCHANIPQASYDDIKKTMKAASEDPKLKEYIGYTEDQVGQIISVCTPTENRHQKVEMSIHCIVSSRHTDPILLKLINVTLVEKGDLNAHLKMCILQIPFLQ